MTALTLSGLPMTKMALRRLLAFLLVLGAVVPLSACGTTSPQDWLDANLTKVGGSDPASGIFYSSTKPQDTAAQQISSGTSPDDSIVNGGSSFLRYGDDYMVVVATAAGVATAELWTFDAGFALYSAQVAAWGEFRGGGSGEGK